MGTYRICLDEDAAPGIIGDSRFPTREMAEAILEECEWEGFPVEYYDFNVQSSRAKVRLPKKGDSWYLHCSEYLKVSRTRKNALPLLMGTLETKVGQDLLERRLKQ